MGSKGAETRKMTAEVRQRPQHLSYTRAYHLGATTQMTREAAAAAVEPIANPWAATAYHYPCGELGVCCIGSDVG